MKNGFRPYWISNVTQVPAVVGMVCEAAANVYPSPDEGARRTFDHAVLAREIMRRHRAAFGVGEEAIFDADRSVILNAYTGGSDHLKKTWAEAPRHRDERFNELCRRSLDYERGDDFLQLGQVNLFTLWRYLSHALPRDAWAVALSRYSFVLANTLVVPVLQWLRPDHAMGHHAVMQPTDGVAAAGRAQPREQAVHQAGMSPQKHASAEAECHAHVLEVRFVDRGRVVGEAAQHRKSVADHPENGLLPLRPLRQS